MRLGSLILLAFVCLPLASCGVQQADFMLPARTGSPLSAAGSHGPPAFPQGPLAAKGALAYGAQVANQYGADAAFAMLVGDGIGPNGALLATGNWQITYAGSFASAKNGHAGSLGSLIVKIDGQGQTTLVPKAGLPVGVLLIFGNPNPSLDSSDVIQLATTHHAFIGGATGAHMVLSTQMNLSELPLLAWRIDPGAGEMGLPFTVNADTGQILNMAGLSRN
jgi:hypothetical protein